MPKIDLDKLIYNPPLDNDPSSYEVRRWLGLVKTGLIREKVLGLISEENYRRLLDEIEEMNAWKVSKETFQKVVGALEYYAGDGGILADIYYDKYVRPKNKK